MAKKFHDQIYPSPSDPTSLKPKPFMWLSIGMIYCCPLHTVSCLYKYCYWYQYQYWQCLVVDWYQNHTALLYVAQRMSGDIRYAAQNYIFLPPTKFWSQFEWQRTKSCSFCPKLSWNVRIQKRLCLLCGHPCPLKGLQHFAFTDSDHRMNGCQEMLSPTFQPFWSFKSLPKHVWTCSWIS